MSDERDRFPTENEETEEADVEAHRNSAARADVAKNDEGENTGDEPDVEAHRWSSGSTRHDVP